MKKTICSVAFASLALAAIGCDSKTPAEPESPGEVEAVPKSKAESQTITVAKEGTEIEPPVAPAKLPAGAYYCDMGTVHYARMEEGDGKCALCGMPLKHKSEQKPADHEGHAHDDN